MSKFESPLSNIKIASPCSADWNEMYGDERKRFCGDCKLNVYNLSGMTKDEAETLVMKADGRLCVRFFQRSDGTIITQDCPVGWARVKQRTRIAVTAASSLLMAIFSGVFFVWLISPQKVNFGELSIPFTTPTPKMEMGAITAIPNSNSNIDEGQSTQVMGKVALPQAKKKKMIEIRCEAGLRRYEKEI